MDLRSGLNDQSQTGGITVPVINTSDVDKIVHWVGTKQAQFLLNGVNTNWKAAHIYYMEQAAYWQNKIRDLGREKIERNLDYMGENNG